MLRTGTLGKGNCEFKETQVDRINLLMSLVDLSSNGLNFFQPPSARETTEHGYRQSEVLHVLANRRTSELDVIFFFASDDDNTWMKGETRGGLRKVQDISQS